RPGPTVASPALLFGRRAVPGGVPVDRERFFRAASSGVGALRVLLVVALDVERDSGGDGGHGVLSFGAIFRGGGVRHSRVDGLVRWAGVLLQSMVGGRGCSFD